MEPEELDAFVGQVAADSTFMQAMFISLMEIFPTIDTCLLAKVVVAGLEQQKKLPEPCIHAYQVRLKELQPMVVMARH